MKNKWRIIPFLFSILILILSLVFLYGSFGYKNAGPAVSSIQYLEKMSVSVDGGKTADVTLPHSFKSLKGRTPVTFTADITVRPNDIIYIKSVYAPAKIYIDGELRYEFGKLENYPSFMIDPATEVHLIETGGREGTVKLRMEFLSPVSRSTLTVHPPIIGTSKEVILERSHRLGLPFILSMAQIIYGISLILISVCVSFMDKKGIVFLWLGLISLSTGTWAFGENNFTGIIFKNATFLYLISFIGFFCFIIPLLKFSEAIVDFENKKPVYIMETVMSVCISSVMLLQLFGIVAFSKSMYLFHILLPLNLVLLTGLVFAEFLRHKNKNARRFALPIVILTLSAILELANYQLPFTYVFSSLFQFGILVFLLIMGVTAGLSVKDSMDFKEREKEFAFEKGLVDIQIKEQKERGALLAHKEQILRRQRHDLRHQIAAIQELVREDNRELREYLNTLMDQIPKSEKVFCENRTVNAVVSYYIGICSGRQIETSFDLSVPAIEDSTLNSELCVIFGNLIENAVEACMRMKSGRRFIRLSSVVQQDNLIITMDNSFDGEIRTEGERFRSSKRDDFGVGLASVKSIAETYHGSAEFRFEKNVFYSSVYLRIK